MEDELRGSSDGFGDTRSQDSLSFDRDGNIVLHSTDTQVAKPPRTLHLPLGQFVQNALARNDSTAFSESILSPESLADLSRHIEEYVLRSERLRVSLRQPWEDPMPIGGRQLWEHRPWHLSPSPIAAALAFTPGPVQAPTRAVAPVRPPVPFVHRKVRAVTVQPSADDLRQRSLVFWRIVIEEDLEASTTGLILLGLCLKPNSEAEIANSLSNTFAGKSTATLYKRGTTLMAWLRWCHLESIKRPLSFAEDEVYHYLQQMQHSGAAPTKAASFRQALNFAVHIVGLNTAGPALSSPRIAGLCRAMLGLKPPTRQALVLLCDEIMILESYCLHGECVQDLIAAGFFLYMLFSCSRFSDAQHVSFLEADVDVNGIGFLEGGTREHKTATTSAKKAQFLPLVSPTQGLLSLPWARPWLEARESEGLAIGSGGLLNAPARGGGWTSRQLTTGEGTLWLRDLLLAGGADPNRVAKTSTHSLKATVCSFAAKDNWPLELRRFLAHHQQPGDQSALTYSRDAMSGPMAALVDMLERIASGQFCPDDPRSKRIRRTADPPVKPATTARKSFVAGPIDLAVLKRECQDLEADSLPDLFDMPAADTAENDLPVTSDHYEFDAVDSSASDSGSHSDSSDVSSGCEVHRDVPLIQVVRPDLVAGAPSTVGGDLFQHNIFSTVHLRPTSTPSHFKCGRRVHAGYSKYDGLGLQMWPRCKQCF
jgi:hypothetical protein